MILAVAYIIVLFYMQGSVIEVEGYQIRFGGLLSFFGEEKKQPITDAVNDDADAERRLHEAIVLPASEAMRNERPDDGNRTTTIATSESRIRQHTCRTTSDKNDTGTTFIQAPDVIIAGTQKSGTTAIRAWLNQHPAVVGSVFFEQHFFDHEYPRLLQQARSDLSSNRQISVDGADDDEHTHCFVRRQYMRSMQVANCMHQRAANLTRQTNISRIISFEKSPSYLLWPHIPAAVRRTCPWMPYIIVVLRNPVDRLYSQYRMEYSRAGAGNENYPTLEQVLNSELDKLRQHGLTRAPPLLDGSELDNNSTLFNIRHIDQALRDDKDGILNRDFAGIPSYKRYLQRGMYSVQLQRWITQYDKTKILVLLSEDLQRDPVAAWNQLQDFVELQRMRHLSAEELTLSYGPKQHYGEEDENASVAVAPTMQAATRAYLKAFYQPYNEALLRILGKPLKWD